jgi:hypothetical protein
MCINQNHAMYAFIGVDSVEAASGMHCRPGRTPIEPRFDVKRR